MGGVGGVARLGESGGTLRVPRVVGWDNQAGLERLNSLDFLGKENHKFQFLVTFVANRSQQEVARNIAASGKFQMNTRRNRQAY